LQYSTNTFAQAHKCAVLEREKCVANHYRALEPAALSSRFFENFTALALVFQVCHWDTVSLPGKPVGKFAIGLVPCNFSHAHPVLLAGANTNCAEVFHVQYRVACNSGLDKPAKEHVVEFGCRR